MADEIVAELRRTIDETLAPHVKRGARVALLDFPSSVNVGDNAIWLGEETYLRNAGASVVYRADQHGYSSRSLARKIRNGTILMHGGGNLGDIWEGPQNFRERVIREFPNNDIVVLPQTVHFRDPTNVRRVAAAFDRHKKLTIIARSTKSLEFVRQEFGCDVSMAPDMALALAPLDRSRIPTVDILWLRREDQEGKPYEVPDAPDVACVDWAGLGPMQQLNRALGRRGLGTVRSQGRRVVDAARAWGASVAASSFAIRANRRLQRGIEILSAGRVVVTDRLHGHILCLLLGIPHVAIDTGYGKLTDFYETWTSRAASCRLASSPEEALVHARSLLTDASS